MKKQVAAIVGGYGGMGQIFARLFKQEGFFVRIAGPSESKGKRTAGELGVAYARDNVAAVEDADLVMVSVPIKATVDVIREVGPHIKAGAAFCDTTSIKEEPCRVMAESSKPGVEVLGMHPVFGPRVGGIDGQVFVLTPVRGGKWLPKIKEILSRHRVRIVESTPAEHDHMMAVVQGLTHFTYISTGKTLQELGVDLKRSREFSSPVYDLMLDMIGRIIGQDPHLYAEIQMHNPRVPHVHDMFFNVARKLSDAVRRGDEVEFVRMMVDAARNFGDVDRAMGRSDKAISSLVSELELLKNSIGSELCLEHIYSGKKHLGVVESVTPDEVVLEDNGKRFSLKLSNIRILGGGERMAFKLEKYGSVKRDFSVVFGDVVDEEFVCRLLEEHSENIISVRVGDVYVGPQVGDGRKSVCFNVELVNAGLKEAESSVREFLGKIGGTLR